MITVVNLIGRLGGDPEQKQSQKGTDYLLFNLAVDHGYGDNRKTDWYSCIAFDKVRDRVLKLKAAKGSLVHAIGSLEMETFKRKDGSVGMASKVTLYDLEYIPNGGKKDAQQPSAATAAQPQTPATQQAKTPAVAASAPASCVDGNFEEIPLNGDDLPF